MKMYWPVVAASGPPANQAEIALDVATAGRRSS